MKKAKFMSAIIAIAAVAAAVLAFRMEKYAVAFCYTTDVGVQKDAIKSGGPGVCPIGTIGNIDPNATNFSYVTLAPNGNPDECPEVTLCIGESITTIPNE